MRRLRQVAVHPLGVFHHCNFVIVGIGVRAGVRRRHRDVGPVGAIANQADGALGRAKARQSVDELAQGCAGIA